MRRAVSMGDGARSADVWVVSDKAVSASTLLPAADAVRIRRIAGVVPSRAADNLFWLGRYLERAEATLRLIRALGTPTRDARHGSTSTARTRSSASSGFSVTWGAASQATRANPRGSPPRRCRAPEKFGSALSLAQSAQRTASSLRERLSPDAWQIITEMVERLALQVDDDDGVVSAAELTLQELASLAGLAQENMNRAAGWRFLDMGRRAERAINTARFARQFAYDEAGDDDLDVLLTLVDCQITYRSRYLVGPALAPVRDLAVLDPYNPRSVAFQVADAERSHRRAAEPEGARPDRAAAAAGGGVAGDADDGGSGVAGRQEPVRAGAGSAQPRRRRSACITSRTAPMPSRPEKLTGLGVIYDIRHVTTYAYESPVSFARCSLRLEPKRRRPAVDLAYGRDPAAAGRAHRAARFLRHPYRERADRGRASQSADRFPLARVGRSRRRADRAAPSPAWETCATWRSRPASLGPASPVGYVFASALVPVQAPRHRLCRAELPAGRRHPRRRRRSDAPHPRAISDMTRRRR